MRNINIGLDNDAFDVITENQTANIKLNGVTALVLGGEQQSNALVNRIVVRQASDFGVIDSTKEYFLDGIIDMGSTSIEVPSSGINIKGYDFNTSGLVSTADNYTMFTSPAEGSGDIIWSSLNFSVSGTSSRLLNIKSNNGFNAVEISAVNYNNCTSLGTIDNYRQGFETGTGRFGSSPSLTLAGAWAGGFLVTDSITRSMSDSTTEPLFKAGTDFVMQSRFKTNMNVDLGDLQAFCDFSDTNFPNPSTLQLQGMEVTRDGAYDPTDTNITPNIAPNNLSSSFSKNNGIENTHVGGLLALSSEATTTISTIDTFVTISGTYTASDLQHFDSPSQGQLRNLGNTPRDFKVICYVVIDGSPNNNVTVRVRKFDTSTSTTSTVVSQIATINSLSGPDDRATYSILGRVSLDINDYIFIEVANNTGTENVTAKIGTFITVEER